MGQNPIEIGRRKHEELMVLFDKILEDNAMFISQILEAVAQIDLIDYERDDTNV